jgi:hypothetical protein
MSVFDGTVSPTEGGSFRIGYIDHINGESAKSSGFVVTRHELEQVARYWFRTHLSNDLGCFLYQFSGSTEWRIAVYSSDRLDAIGKVIGAERLKELCNEEREEMSKTVEPRTWQVFSGTASEEERAAWFVERDAWEMQIHEEYEKEFQGELLKLVNGNPCDIKPGTIGMEKAIIANRLVAESPELAFPAQIKTLMSKVEEIHGRDNEVVVKLEAADIERIEGIGRRAGAARRLIDSDTPDGN